MSNKGNSPTWLVGMSTGITWENHFPDGAEAEGHPCTWSEPREQVLYSQETGPKAALAQCSHSQQLELTPMSVKRTTGQYGVGEGGAVMQ